MPFPFAFWKTTSAVFNPATLALAGWWRASFGGSPWAAVASAGGSGGNGNLTEATNPPAVGTALNGLTPADFDGTNDNLGNANNVDPTFIDGAGGKFHVSILLNADTAGANSAGAPYAERGLLMDDTNGFWCVTHAVRGVTVGVVDSGVTWQEATVACATGGWHLVHVWGDGTNLKAQIDSGGAVTGGAFTAIGFSAGTPLKVGRNYNSSAFFDGKIAEIMIATTDLGATARSNIKSYINSRYGLAL